MIDEPDSEVPVSAVEDEQLQTEVSTITPSYTHFEQALMARLAYHMSSTDMEPDTVEALGRVFIQRIESKMIRLRDGQNKHGGDFLNNVDHDNERRQEMDDAEWYDIANILNNNTSVRLKI